MADCPLALPLNTTYNKMLSECTKQTMLLSVALEIAESIIEPILGEMLSAVDAGLDVYQTIANTLDDIVNSINPTSWVLYIAKYQSQKIYDCANYEILLLNRMKLFLKSMGSEDVEPTDIYARLEKICNRLRNSIDNALEKASGNYYNDVPTVLNKIDYAKGKANALRVIMSLDRGGIGRDIKNALMEGFTIDAAVDKSAENYGDLVEIRKKKKGKIRTAPDNTDWDKFFEKLNDSAVDSLGRYITTHMIRVLASYTQIVRLYSGHDISKHRKILSENVDAMGTEESSEKIREIKPGDFVKDIGKAAFTPHFTDNNTPNILDWVYDISGNVNQLTIFGCHAQVMAGAGIISSLSKLVPDITEQSSEDYVANKGELLTKIKTELNFIKESLPEKCDIGNINDRLNAWATYNGIYRELVEVRQYIGKDLEQMVTNEEYIGKLKAANKSLNEIDWDGDEPTFATNIIFTLGISIIKDMFSGNYSYDSYAEMINARIEYLSQVKNAVKDLRDYSDPYMDGVIDAMKDLGLYSLVNNLMDADIIFKNISISDSLVAGAGIAALLYNNCIKPNIKNPSITNAEKKKMNKICGEEQRKIKEQQDALVQKLLDRALQPLGYGKDLMNKIIELKNNNVAIKGNIDFTVNIKDRLA